MGSLSSRGNLGIFWPKRFEGTLGDFRRLKATLGDLRSQSRPYLLYFFVARNLTGGI